MARFTGGWIKLYRSILDKTELVDDFELLGLWVYLLTIANYTESKIDWGNQVRILQPGQMLITQREIVKRFNIPKTNLLRRLNYLEKWDRINLESGPHGTIVTIRNWKEYQTEQQSSGPQADQEADHKRTTSGPQADQYKEVQEGKNERRKERKLPAIRFEYPSEFESFWKGYKCKPGRGSKGEACKIFMGYSPDERRDCLQAIEVYKRTNPTPDYRKGLDALLRTDWRVLLESTPLSNGKDHADDDTWDFLPKEGVAQ